MSCLLELLAKPVQREAKLWSMESSIFSIWFREIYINGAALSAILICQSKDSDVWKEIFTAQETMRNLMECSSNYIWNSNAGSSLRDTIEKMRTIGDKDSPQIGPGRDCQ